MSKKYRRTNNKFYKPEFVMPKLEPKPRFARPAWFMHEDIKVISRVSGNRVLNGNPAKTYRSE